MGKIQGVEMNTEVENDDLELIKSRNKSNKPFKTYTQKITKKKQSMYFTRYHIGRNKGKE